MRRLGLLLLALLALAAPAAAAPAQLPGTFRVGDGVACSLAGRTLVCEGARSGSMAIRATGTPASTRHQVAAGASTRVLRPGQTWRRQGIVCRALRAEVSCRNLSGAVLRLSATRVVVLADTGAATSP